MSFPQVTSNQTRSLPGADAASWLVVLLLLTCMALAMYDLHLLMAGFSTGP